MAAMRTIAFRVPEGLVELAAKVARMQNRSPRRRLRGRVTPSDVIREALADGLEALLECEEKSATIAALARAEAKKPEPPAKPESRRESRRSIALRGWKSRRATRARMRGER